MTGGTQSVLRALKVLRLVADQTGGGIRFVDVVRRSGLGKSTVHRLLECLEQEQFVHRDAETRRYQLGLESVQLGLSAAQNSPLVDHCLPVLKRLSRMTGEPTFLTIRHGDFGLILRRVEGESAAVPINTGVGVSRLLGIGPGCTALLARLKNEEFEDLIVRNALEYERVGLAIPRLRASVAAARTLGYAETRGQITFDLCGVGAAFRIGSGALAALSTSAPSARMSAARSKSIGQLLLTEARALEAGLNARPV